MVGLLGECGLKFLSARRESVPLMVRVDTPIEAAYFAAGGILPYVLGQMLERSTR